MSRITSGITTSIDGYFVGPHDGPGKGLGESGERLHAWVFGGAWSYDDEARGEPVGADKAYLDEVEGFDKPLTLEPLKIWHSPLATHIQYRVVR